MSDPWSQQLWSTITDTYGAILAHPFIAALTDGTLAAAAFTHYVAQDAHYLRDYARALMVVGAKAPNHVDAAMFARHADGAIQVESALHANLLDSFGLTAADLEAIAVTPTTQAYTSYLLATAHGGSFAEGLAAVLPCYWIYESVGRELLTAGSPEPRYQKWIATYGGDEFGQVVREVLDLTDQVGRGLAPEEAARAGRHFVQTARYEWMFWDASWRLEAWPI